jgi:hypothetical protein
MRRLSYVWLAGLGAIAVTCLLGALALGCATTNCTETATCGAPADDSSDDMSLSPDVPPAPDAPDTGGDTGDDGGRDADSTVGPETGGDAPNDGADGGPEAQAETGTDAGDGGTDADAGAGDGEAGIDANPTDAPPDVQDSGHDANDACVPTGVEICTDGIDNDCNGLADCADTKACPGYQCVQQVPTGWSGPIELYNGSPASLPTCSTGYTGAGDYHGGGLSWTADTCSCTCTATGQTCTPSGTFYSDGACHNSPTATGTADGTCTTVPTNTLGSGGSFIVAGGGAVSPTGGSCSSSVATTPGSAPTWTAGERLCTPTVVDSPGGCTATQQCVPPPSPPFGATLCIWQSGNVSCPAAPSLYTNPIGVYYTDVSDTRGCGPCTCAGPTGGSCAGSIGLWGTTGGMGCPGTATASYTLGTTCKAYSGLFANPGYVKATYTLTAGSCSVSAQPQPDGGVAGTGPVTVCCM